MRGVLRRLRQLERAADVGGGCAACRDRQGRTVLVSATSLPDGTAAPRGDRPAPCAACGRVPELVIEVVETVVGPDSGAPPRERHQAGLLWPAQDAGDPPHLSGQAASEG
jgi:hypothetical protein